MLVQSELSFLPVTCTQMIAYTECVTETYQFNIGDRVSMPHHQTIVKSSLQLTRISLKINIGSCFIEFIQDVGEIGKM